MTSTNRFRFAFVVVPVGLVAAAGSALAGDIDVIVGFKSSADASVIEKKGGKAQGDAIGKAMAAHVPASAVAALRADPDVAYVEEDGICEIQGRVESESKQGSGGGGTSQPAQSIPAGITRVNGGAASGQSGLGVKVAVIDTGTDLTHPDLAANIGASKNFVSSARSANDDNGHGSHVSGTIAALDNSIGVEGVAVRATILPVKVLDRAGSGTWTAVAAGIRWAADNGAHIGSMSLGGGASQTLADACTYARSKGTLLVAAAGNSGDGNLSTTELSYPGAYSNVIAVGAVNSSDVLASFSNTGSFVDVAGPGVSVFSTYKNGGYATLSGTSMATPHASGVAALIWAKRIAAGATATADAVESELRATAQDQGPAGVDNGSGSGVVHFSNQ